MAADGARKASPCPGGTPLVALRSPWVTKPRRRDGVEGSCRIAGGEKGSAHRSLPSPHNIGLGMWSAWQGHAGRRVIADLLLKPQFSRLDSAGALIRAPGAWCGSPAADNGRWR